MMFLLKKRVFAIILILFTLNALASPANPKLNVVTSFSILGDIVRNIGGDKIDEKSLVGRNSDAHVYEPTPADLISVSKADIIFINGLGFEGFIERLTQSNGTTSPIITVSDGVERLKNEEDASHHGHDHGEDTAHHDHGEWDPHAWNSVPNVLVYVDNITTAFCKIDNINCSYYQNNANAYKEKLNNLDQEIKSIIATIPENKRTIITSHDAFNYFDNQYGIHFLSPQGISTESEVSAMDLAKLIDQIILDEVSALFVENISNPRLINQISSETGISVGGELYSDALSNSDGPAATYIDLMLNNAKTIKMAIDKTR